MNPFADAPQSSARSDWWLISDFGNSDIKGLWELSRFDWVVALATNAAHGDKSALKRLNLWLTDWSKNNPLYKGHNWKCGQEASIRVMHLVTAAWILHQDGRPEPGLVDLIKVHLQRIAPTMSYAISQQNNHGTSEAAALFIGGSFLSGHERQADDWMRKGRHWLEERAMALIEADGSFSQYSVTYHRLMLDTYSLANAWQRHRQLPAFTIKLNERLGAATYWLLSLTDKISGDAPNLGANDGARLLQFTDSDYRDFRPSIQLAAALYLDGDAFGQGPWNASLQWLDIPNGSSTCSPVSKSYDDGGYHVPRIGETIAVLRYPRFRFRPSQADALHVDLWHKGSNLIRDGGTFSYNADDSNWFAGTAAHNTIEFDQRDQMPRLGRFLFGDWLQAESVEKVRVEDGDIIAAAGYTDSKGARHHRKIILSSNSLTCEDTISGKFTVACIRWRLLPGAWRLAGHKLENGSCTILIEVDGVAIAPTLTTTEESRYYQQRQQVPLATVSVSQPSVLVTKVAF